jgi:hypothetical protein
MWSEDWERILMDTHIFLEDQAFETSSSKSEVISFNKKQAVLSAKIFQKNQEIQDMYMFGLIYSLLMFLVLFLIN